MNDVFIRESNFNDQKNITTLLINSAIDVFGREPINRDDYGDFSLFYKEKKGIFYVAELNNKIVGCIAIKQEEGNLGRLRRMSVKKEYRKMGIAKLLFDSVINFCKKNHYSKIMLCTYPEMEAALSFYHKENFKLYKQEGRAIYMEKYL